MARKPNPKIKGNSELFSIEKWNENLQFGTKKTQATMEVFLNALAKGYSVNKARQEAGLSYTIIYKWRKEDPEFAEAWESALEAGKDRIEDEIFRRGHDGIDKNIYYQGELVDVVTEYSDPLLLAKAKAKIPDYRNTGDQGQVGPITVNIQDFGKPND